MPWELVTGITTILCGNLSSPADNAMVLAVAFRSSSSSPQTFTTALNISGAVAILGCSLSGWAPPVWKSGMMVLRTGRKEFLRPRFKES